MEQRKYDTVIFDLDGTLLNTLEDLTDAVNHALREKGMPERTLAEIYFEGIVTVAIGEREGVAKKPAKDSICEALKELGMPVETAVYVGDSEVDIQTAKNAGLPCITVLWGFREEAFLREQGATRFARAPEEIMQYL